MTKRTKAEIARHNMDMRTELANLKRVHQKYKNAFSVEVEIGRRLKRAIAAYLAAERELASAMEAVKEAPTMSWVTPPDLADFAQSVQDLRDRLGVDCRICDGEKDDA